MTEEGKRALVDESRRKHVAGLARARRDSCQQMRDNIIKYLVGDDLRSELLKEIDALQALQDALSDEELGEPRENTVSPVRHDLSRRVFDACFPYIKMPELIDGAVYEINARNAYVGVWRADQRGFEIPRQKFDNLYLFTEYHWDTGPPYGTAKPYGRLEDPPPEVVADRERLLAYLDAINLKLRDDPPPRKTP